MGGSSMAKWKRFAPSLSGKILLMIMAFILLPIVGVMFFVRDGYEGYIQRQLNDQIVSTIAKTEDVLYTRFQNMAGISSAIVTNDSLLSALRDRTQNYYSITKSFDECVRYSQINNLFDQERMLITLMDAKGRLYTNWGMNYHDYSFLPKQEWVSATTAKKGHLHWELSMPSYLYEEQNSFRRYVSLSRLIQNDFDMQRPLGILLISVDEAYFSHLLSLYCFDENDSVAILGADNSIVLSYHMTDAVNGQLVSQAVSDLERNRDNSRVIPTEQGAKLVSYYAFTTPWTFSGQTLKLVHFTDYQQVVNRMSAISSKMNTILMLTTVMCVIIAVLIAYLMTRPIRKLSLLMRRYTMGSQIVGIDLKRQDEIGYLNRSFTRLTGNLAKAFSQLETQITIKERYRFESLRAQLNPHFLFNTLNSLKYMAMLHGEGSLCKGMEALAAMLNYSIGRTGEYATIHDELVSIRGYIYIQNLRYGQHIELETDFSEEDEQLYAIRFLLQPIVENAVLHGLKDNEKKGQPSRVLIYGHTEGDQLLLFVEDNGVGISEEQMNAFQQGLPLPLEKRRDVNGIGLGNIRDMIRIAYGDPYTIRLEKRSSGGTIVRFCIPVMHEGKETENHEKNLDC